MCSLPCSLPLLASRVHDLEILRQSMSSFRIDVQPLTQRAGDLQSNRLSERARHRLRALVSVRSKLFGTSYRAQEHFDSTGVNREGNNGSPAPGRREPRVLSLHGSPSGVICSMSMGALISDSLRAATSDPELSR
jgi:hypothetical protein